MQVPIFGRVILTQQDVPENFTTLEKGWGGECRVEVTLTARLLAQGRVLVTVNRKLFKGTDELTGDLEDEQNASEVVPRGESLSHSLCRRIIQVLEEATPQQSP
jgi:hypothetical protein